MKAKQPEPTSCYVPNRTRRMAVVEDHGLKHNATEIGVERLPSILP